MKSIRMKLWIWMLVLIAFVFMFLWIFQIFFLESFYLNTQIKKSRAQGQGLAALWESSKIDFQEETEQLALEMNIVVEIINAEHELIYISQESNDKVALGKNIQKTELIQEAFHGKADYRAIEHPKFKNQIILIGIPVYENQQIVAAMIMNMPTIQIEETSRFIKNQLLWMTLLLLLVATAMAYGLSKQFVSPILKIQRVASQIAQGKFGIQVIIKEKDEIGHLAKAINEMSISLEQIESNRREFLANVSHELRTPLSLIKGYAEMIRDISGENPEKRNKQLERIIIEADRLNGMVNDILLLTQIDSGQKQFVKERFVLNAIIHQVINQFDILAHQKRIDIDFIATDLYIVSLDKLSIMQVFYNLISNAIKHVDIDGKIIIKLVEKDGQLKVEIIDDGPGIPANQIDYIWDRYVKGDYPEMTNQKGLGLGLAITQKIFEGQKLLYGVDSELGEGSCFWFMVNIEEGDQLGMEAVRKV